LAARIRGDECCPELNPIWIPVFDGLDYTGLVGFGVPLALHPT
jgi:hypothetical protein